MATRMQQRRGTALQWSSANPILASGEIGFETDTSKFKIGDGINHWDDLTYFASAAEISNLIDGAPDLLNTLNELAAAIGDDANFATTIQNAVDLAEDNANVYSTGILDTHNQDTTNVHGISNTADLATQDYVDGLVDNHKSDTTQVHGIEDTSLLVTTTGVQTLTSKTITNPTILVGSSGSEVTISTTELGYINGVTSNIQTQLDDKASTLDLSQVQTDADNALSTHASDTASVHGIADTAELATKTYADNAVSTHNNDTTSVHGISDTADLVYTSDLSGHSSDTTNIHGIVDTAELVTLSGTETLSNKTFTDITIGQAPEVLNGGAGIMGQSATSFWVSMWTNDVFDGVATITISGSTSSDGTYDVVSAGGPGFTLAEPGISSWATLTFGNETFTLNSAGSGSITETEISYLSGLTSGIQSQLDSKATPSDITNHSDDTTNIHGIADTSKLVTTDATSQTIDGAITITGNLTVQGTTTTVSATDLEITDPLIYIGTGNSANANDLGVVGHFDDGTYQHTGIVRDATDGVWKLFSGVTTEPTGTIDFTSATYDTIQVGGIKFSDGTQVKAGVPSITTFATAISSSATLASGEQDKFIPLTGAVTITLPSSGYVKGQSIDFYQESGTGAQFASTNSVVGTPGLKFRTTNSVATAMKTDSGWLVFGDLSA